jgi:hypothetical protein
LESRAAPGRDSHAAPLHCEGGRCRERSFQRSLTPELRRTRLSARTQAGSNRGCGERGPRFPEALGHAANHQSQKEVGRDTTVDGARHGAAALALPVAAGGSSGGLSPKQLGDAGWTCFNVPGLGVHCAAPGQAWPPTEPVVQLLYFFNTTDPSSSVPDFTGTETLIRADIFNGQPCPTQPGESYTDLSSLGLNYWGCHHR